MDLSKPADKTSCRARHIERAARPASRLRLNAYPLLGILLVIVPAVLAYGGLFLLLID
ncbi:hypothetical protein [Massilia sp. X63]|uniref:hypothetical protein n=1 Tax=Massilia sp. X63 TaxID=3237285 RepID=UPI0034DCCDAB